jgi:hypothetical protein
MQKTALSAVIGSKIWSGHCCSDITHGEWCGRYVYRLPRTYSTIVGENRSHNQVVAILLVSQAAFDGNADDGFGNTMLSVVTGHCK